jgi:hypothetical protein
MAKPVAAARLVGEGRVNLNRADRREADAGRVRSDWGHGDGVLTPGSGTGMAQAKAAM